eukprot:TRINITY_DN2860_c0_g2_i1.p1 TRINITY_DN2860_c0_g2~~TRINITY_DN2860_c0_g2_i1.p1  ORF type:complete len:982 (+),score=190.02 TRINITY_DN2860_c0_g2_i1:215-2947(+)
MLWCYKKELSFGASSRAKRAARFKKEVERGIATVEGNSEFETFLAQNKIRFCYYKDSHKVLGQTFGMCVLQDFEALTPNLLARTMETVEGGGLVVILIKSLKSLRQLYTITMDVHQRYRTSQHSDIVPRFNERFLLSLADCKSFLCVSDKLEVLPFTTATRSGIQQVPKDIFTEEEKKLKLLQIDLKGNELVGPLIEKCVTLDQATSVLGMMEAVAEKTLTTTSTVTAGRGRGKSAALGLVAAGAVSQGYSNIFITAPSPENVQTLFEFATKGLEAMGYTERVDYSVVQADSDELSNAVIRINVFKGHRQTIQYLLPTDSTKFAQAELLIVDEAAAIPLPIVKSLMGPYLVFLSTTITGYEGTGRSLSLKFFSELKKQARGSDGSEKSGRTIKDIKLSQPIRYASNDPVEAWLNKVLCLEPKTTTPPPVHPDTLELFYVNRDTLFSYHSVAEELLQRIVTLYVSSHYKNQPNDLQLLSDAPAHHLFVLLDVNNKQDGAVPHVYAVIQCCLEGNIAGKKLEQDLSKGIRPSGDIIPYTLSQNFQEHGFAELPGMRVFRIAVSPELTGKEYGTKALQLLTDYYNGKICPVSTSSEPTETSINETEDGGFSIAPRKNLPHLLHRLTDRAPESCAYLGVGFGLTCQLYNFWHRAGFTPVYLRQGKNDLTGEHSMMMIKSLEGDSYGAQSWVSKFGADFRKRFIRLLPLSFKSVPLVTALGVVTDRDEISKSDVEVKGNDCYVLGVKQLNEQELLNELSTYDLQRISAYCRQMVDRGVILDLVPTIANMYFAGRLAALPTGAEGVVLPLTHRAVLLALGLQGLMYEDIIRQPEFASTEVNQLSSFFDKALSRINTHFNNLRTLDDDNSDNDEIAPTKGAPQGIISVKKTAKAKQKRESGSTPSTKTVKRKKKTEN